MYVAIEKSVYVYQTCGGCLIAVLEAGHIASIEALAISEQRRHPALSLPLLLSSDTSGLVVCWPALVSPDDSVVISNSNAGESGTSHHKPLWYVVQASRGLPHCAFLANGRMVACAGTNGIKVGLLIHSFVQPGLCSKRKLILTPAIIILVEGIDGAF